MVEASNRDLGHSTETDFGFRRVTIGEHRARIRRVFDSVAPRYDLMNDLMSGGLHRVWKSALLDWLNPRPGMTLLDVAGGTGDVAFGFLTRATRDRLSASAIVCDSNPEMLTVAVDRALDRGLIGGLSYVCGNAESLPLPNRSVDVCTIAFGLRNVSYRGKALCEMRRILKPGGHFLCLEFSRVVVPLLTDLYDGYSFRVLPALGQWVAGDRDAYKYLVESIRRFPDQVTLAREFTDAGFDNVAYRNLSGGIVALHSGWRV